MTFRILALDPAPFVPLFALSDAELAARDIVRATATSDTGFPCRVSLADAATGEELLLLNYEHLPVASPYRSRHAIYVGRHAVRAEPAPGSVPPYIERRLISARAFDAAGMMTRADVVEGAAVAETLDAWLNDASTAHVDLHSARPGCFLARAVAA
ncbi:DUF1203 domain-containing protein [Glacieibacterium frigidum]|uniref:DUF1203 domain-containing protein n=1 Tax=Glacieibacterium frigidum TaxID=2593303 RepID=A0A552UF86_9SPHN|nr:DUF1203 domain-containing protein [Glacieibacterium frigidum]TRW16883.1 DUF1203 domain-containing protein [Glacieibacterium frigidum]